MTVYFLHDRIRWRNILVFTTNHRLLNCFHCSKWLTQSKFVFWFNTKAVILKNILHVVDCPKTPKQAKKCDVKLTSIMVTHVTIPVYWLFFNEHA